MTTTLNDAYRQGKTALQSLPGSDLDARILLKAAASITEERFFTHPETTLTARQKRAYFRLIRKRQNGFPTAYLTGEKEFWSLPFRVKPGVLIPRPETELLVEKTIELSEKQTQKIVDIGTGSGIIAVCLAKEIPQAEVLATDISRRALRLARANSRHHGLTGIRFFHGDLYTPLKRRSFSESCDFIVSNPPYVSEQDWTNCTRDITEFEPKRALVPGRTGLEFISRLIDGAIRVLKPGGFLLFEIGDGQKDRVMPFFGRNWGGAESFPDLAGIPRVIVARKI